MSDSNVNLDKIENQMDLDEMMNEEIVELSFIQSIYAIIMNPKLAFEAIKHKPRILLPIITVLAVMLLSSLVMWDAIKAYTMEAMRYQMQAQGQDVAMLPESVMSMVAMSTFAGILIMIPVAIAVKGLAIHGFMQLFNGKGTVKQSISIVANAYIVATLSSIIKMPLVMMTGNYGVSFSPALFLSKEQLLGPYGSVLAYFDVFIIWYLIVSIIGVTVIHKTSKGKSAVAVLVPYSIMVGIGILGAVVSSMMT